MNKLKHLKCSEDISAYLCVVIIKLYFHGENTDIGYEIINIRYKLKVSVYSVYVY